MTPIRAAALALVLTCAVPAAHALDDLRPGLWEFRSTRLSLAGLPDMDKVSVLAALLVFRLFYLVVPLILGIIVVILFERSQFAGRRAAPPPD